MNKIKIDLSIFKVYNKRAVSKILQMSKTYYQ